MSSTLQSRHLQILASVSVVIASSWLSFLIAWLVNFAASWRSFFFISLSMSKCHNFLYDTAILTFPFRLLAWLQYTKIYYSTLSAKIQYYLRKFTIKCVISQSIQSNSVGVFLWDVLVSKIIFSHRVSLKTPLILQRIMLPLLSSTKKELLQVPPQRTYNSSFNFTEKKINGKHSKTRVIEKSLWKGL